jgi:hypothetical protein
MMGSILPPSENREGVLIEAPHGWEINDVHHQWNKNETYHWETGNTFHMTSGQVLHVSLNLAELHTTANVATMHLDITPLNVHMRPMPIGFDVHIEASHLRKHVNVHGGHHHQLVSNFHQESQAVHIKSTTKAQSGWDKAADLLAHSPDHLGTMTLEADGEMTLESKTSIRLSANARGMLHFDNKGNAELVVTDNVTLASRKTVVKAGNSEATLKNGELKLESGAAIVTLSNGNLTTNGTETKLNGKVTLGQPATSNIATKDEVEGVLTMTTGILLNELEAQIAALRARLP